MDNNYFNKFHVNTMNNFEDDSIQNYNSKTNNYNYNHSSQNLKPSSVEVNRPKNVTTNIFSYPNIKENYIGDNDIKNNKINNKNEINKNQSDHTSFAVPHPVKRDPIKLNNIINNQNIINDQNIINNNDINKINTINTNNNIIDNKNDKDINLKVHKKKPHTHRSFFRKKTADYNLNSNEMLNDNKTNKNNDQNFLTIIKSSEKGNLLKEHWQLEKILLDYNILDFSSKYNK